MPSHREAGFTLLETLVAVAILSIALVSLLRAVSGGVQGLQRTDRSALAVAIATSVLESARMTAAGDGRDSQGYTWRVQTAPYAGSTVTASPSSQKARWVSVTVNWQAPPGPSVHTFALRQLMMEPAP